MRHIREIAFGLPCAPALPLVAFLIAATPACNRNSATEPADLGASNDAGAPDAAMADAGSPTGSFIVAPIMPDGGDSPQLFRMKADGSDLLQLTMPTGVGLPTDANDMPVTARDRKSIYFASGRQFPPSSISHNFNPMYRTIFVMGTDGSNPLRVTMNDWQHCTEHPEDISPDGNWLVFTMSCDNVGLLSGTEKFYRIHPDGTGQEMLVPNDPLTTSPGTVVGFAAFTGDGKTLIYRIDDGQSWELWKVDLATLKTTQLTQEASAGYQVTARKPMIAPGDKVVYFTSITNDFSSARVEQINFDGTGSQVLFEIANDPDSLGRVDDRFALSPEGDAFVFANGTDSQSIVVSGLDGKNRKTIYGSSMFIGWGDLSWR